MKNSSSSDSENDYELLDAAVSQNQMMKGYKQNYEMYRNKNIILEKEIDELTKKLEIKEAQNKRLREQKLSLSVRVDNYEQQLRELKRELERQEALGQKKGIEQFLSESIIENDRGIQEILSGSLYLKGVQEGDAHKAFSRALSKQNKQLKAERDTILNEKKTLKKELDQISLQQHWNKQMIKSDFGQKIIVPFIDKFSEKFDQERKNHMRKEENLTIKIELLERKLTQREQYFSEKIEIKERQLKEKQSLEIVLEQEWNQNGEKEVLEGLKKNLKKLVKGEIVDNKFESVVREVRAIVDEHVKQVKRENERIIQQLKMDSRSKIGAYERGLEYVIANIKYLEEDNIQLINQLQELDILCLQIQRILRKQRSNQELKFKEIENELKSKLEERKKQFSKLVEENSKLERKRIESEMRCQKFQKDAISMKEKCKQIESENFKLENKVRNMEEEFQGNASIPEETVITLPQIFQFLAEYIEALEMPVDKIRAKNKIAWFVTQAIQI